uniref:60S ribosomal protein L14 n=1 Tax=Heterosigma akashiwo TaxID=2829 RepID=A0A7S3XQU4_HETAK
MVNQNYVKVGRVVRILRGPRTDKIAVISAIIDTNRVLVENPEDNKMWRHVQSVKNIEPSKFSVALPTNASTKKIKAALATKNVFAKYNGTVKAQSIAAKNALASSTELERYQLRVAKRQRAHIARKIFTVADEKENVSLHRQSIRKLEKQHSKFETKKLAARHDRIKKFFAKKKAKRAGKGKNAGKK